jgi:hypothetical protein
VFAQELQSLDKSLALYRRMLTFWQLHLSVVDPDLRQLADIHKALCRLEFELYPQLLDECITNLTQRLRETDHLALDLSLPLWACNALAQLETAIQEKQS